MTKRLWIAMCLFVSMTVFAQDQPESATQKSYIRARGVLEAGIKAMGGPDAAWFDARGLAINARPFSRR